MATCLCPPRQGMFHDTTLSYSIIEVLLLVVE